MVDAFTSMNFTTSSGEDCAVTKDNGAVLIQSDKNVIKQMPSDKLERSPKKDMVSFASNSDIKANKPAKKSKKGLIAGLTVALMAIATFAIMRGKGKLKVKPEKPVTPPPGAEMPKSIAQILKEAGIVDDKLVKVLEADNITLKITKKSTYQDWLDFIGKLRESGEYGDKIKKIAYIFPDKTKAVFTGEGVDVSKLPKNTYLISALDAEEKTLCSQLVIADELSPDLMIKQVRPCPFGSGCNVFDI